VHPSYCGLVFFSFLAPPSRELTIHSFVRPSRASTMSSSVSTKTTAVSSDASSVVRFPKRLYLDVSPSTTPFQLRAAMERHGRVDDVHIPVSREDGSSRGFAFVTFRRHEDAAAAIAELEGTRLDGMVLHPRWANAPSRTKKNDSGHHQKTAKPKRNGNRKSKRENKRGEGHGN